MNILRIAAAVVCCLFFSAAPAPGGHEAGAIQITGGPGIEIWLDREPRGETNAFDNGLYLPDVPAGRHELKVVKPGFQPLEETLEVEDGLTVEVRLTEKKAANVPESLVRVIDKELVRKKKAASLTVRSIPLHAAVILDGRGIGETDILISPVPAGRHDLRLEYRDKELRESFTVEPEEEVILTGDFKTEVLTLNRRKSGSRGPEDIVLHTARGRKPARFPHREHQAEFECAACHHGVSEDGEKIPYHEGMDIQKCAACHNRRLDNRRLDNLRLAAHDLCKGCHKRMAASGEAGPIGRCSGCHTAAGQENGDGSGEDGDDGMEGKESGD